MAGKLIIIFILSAYMETATGKTFWASKALAVLIKNNSIKSRFVIFHLLSWAGR